MEKSRTIYFLADQFTETNFITLSSHTDHKLQTYRMKAQSDKAPRGVVLYFHGYGSYTGKFAYLAKYYA